MGGRPAARDRAIPSSAGRRRWGLAALLAGLLVGGLAVPAPFLPPTQQDAALPALEAPDLSTTPRAPSPAPSPSATSSPSAAPAKDTRLVRSAPVRVQVASIDVDSGLVDLGLAADGTVEVPDAGFPAGWYTGAPSPGETGPAVLVGHVDWDGAPGVFHRLRDLRPGDEVAVTRADGDVAVFAVSNVQQFAKEAFPTDEVYGDIDHAGLRLITCGGSFDRDSGHYLDNLVAYAELVRVIST